MSTITLKSEKATMDRRSFLTTASAVGVSLAGAALLAGCGGSSNSNQAGTGAPATSGASTLSVNATVIAAEFKIIKDDEDNHVAYLIAAITAAGATPRPAPTFTPSLLTAPNISTLIADSAALENTGTGAYLAALSLPALLANPAVTQAAGSVAIVEGRHAGFLNSLLGRPLLTDPNSGDTSLPAASDYSREVPQLPDQVIQRASAFTGTVGDGPSFQTNLNGGPALPTNATIGSASIIDILNYALFLEYLEASFYNINVPLFFGS